jgi:2-methylaconitate cis-trans-isomerase PrpF
MPRKFKILTENTESLIIADEMEIKDGFIKFKGNVSLDGSKDKNIESISMAVSKVTGFMEFNSKE